MANACSVCEHPERLQIDKALEAPRSDSAVARQYGFSRATIARHRAHSALNSLISLQEEGVSGQIQRLKALAEEELKGSKDPKVRLAVNTRLQSLVELEHRIRSEEADGGVLYKTEAFSIFLTYLLEHLCETCRECVKGAPGVGDTRTG